MPHNQFPKEFEQDAYLHWHNSEFPSDNPLIDKLEEKLKALFSANKENLETVGQLLTQIASHTSTEVSIQTKELLTGDFEIPMIDSLDHSDDKIVAELFKNVPSTINKMWRKNRFAKKDDEFVKLGNLEKEITDLARTSVVSPTLYEAKFFSERLKAWDKVLPKARGKAKKNFSEISRIDVEDEAKPSRGYFAYHSLIHFRNGFVIEVQMFSRLSSVWRKISHKIYEKERISNKKADEIASPESRLISLGHLLHLAECEISRLHGELLAKF